MYTKNLLTSTAIASLATIFAVSAPANAADVYRGESTTPADAYVQDVPAHNPFAGLYIGIQGGGQFTNIDVANQFDGIGSDGFVGGLHAGFNFTAGQLVTGPYVEGGFSNVNTELAGFDLFAQEWYVQGGWLLGFNAWNKSLIYGKLGYEMAKWGSDIPGVEAESLSFVIGGGVDTMVSQNISFGVGVDYIIPDDVEVNGTDITNFVEESESLRAVAKITYRR